MFGSNVHNVTKIEEVRVCGSDTDGSGWVTIKVIAENYSWHEEGEQDQIPSEFTLFMKNKKVGLSQLQAHLAKAIADDMVADLAPKEAEANGS